MLSKEMVERALPATLKSAATPQLVDMINNIAADPLVAETIRNNFVSFSSVLADGKFKAEDYVHAVAFCSYRMMNDSQKDAYFKTFPARMQALLAKGADEKTISSYVSAYAKNKLVNKVMEQTLVPAWILNQHLYQEALVTQATLMRTAQSEKVRTDAANSILTHLAKPKENAASINIDMRETSGLSELKDMMRKMAQQQTNLMADGVTPKQIAAQRLVDKPQVIDVEAKEIP
jgi:hypothetical protein